MTVNQFKVGDRVTASDNCRHHKNAKGNITEVDPSMTTDQKYRVFFDSGDSGLNGLWCYNTSVRLVAPQNKIVITQTGSTTTARLYDGKTIVKSAEAKCSPTDTYDFAIGARLAFDRLMPASEPKKEVVEYREVKRAAKVGEKIKVVALCGRHSPIASVGAVHKVTDENFYGQGRAATRANNVFELREYVVLEPITPPATQDKPKEPIAQLYCVKDYDCCGISVTKGKIYEFNADGYIYYDGNTESAHFESLDDWRRGDNGFAEVMYPLVSRPAKVGEWVYATKDSRFPERFKAGDLLKCTTDDGENMCSSWRGKAIEYNNTVCVIEHTEYLVLDGYQPEKDLSDYEWVYGYKGFGENLACRGFVYEVGKEYDLGEEEKVCSKGFHFCKTLDETHQFYSDNGKNRFCKVQGLVKKGTTYDGKYCARKIKIVEEVVKPKEPEYWSGKAFCVDNKGNRTKYTTGKIYAFTDGLMTDDNGLEQGGWDGPVKTFEEWQKFSASEWQEVKGEQS